MNWENIIKIYDYLQNHDKITSKDVATMCNCSIRTAFRYLDKISTVIPIYSIRGSRGGYYKLK